MTNNKRNNSSLLQGSKILIVDDNIYNLKLVGRILDNQNYRIEFAKDGENGIRLAKRNLPDIILLDIMMPGMDGYEVCKKLKSDPATEDIPIIFLSAKNDNESKIKGFECGGSDYIPKPFCGEELLARVSIHLKYKMSLSEFKNPDQVLKLI